MKVFVYEGYVQLYIEHERTENDFSSIESIRLHSLH
jgi:hypothetical protein